MFKFLRKLKKLWRRAKLNFYLYRQEIIICAGYALFTLIFIPEPVAVIVLTGFYAALVLFVKRHLWR